MLINIRAIKIKVPQSLRVYIKEKLLKSQRYFSNINNIEVFLSRQKYMHIVEIVINAAGQTMRINKHSKDFHSAVDLAVSKIRLQVRKQKEKLKKHRKPVLLNEKYSLTLSEGISLDLTKRKIIPQTSSINDAMERMDENNYMFWIFINSANNKLSVIYKKADLTYGLIEVDKRKG